MWYYVYVLFYVINGGWTQSLDLPRNNCPNLVEFKTGLPGGIQALIYPPNDFSGNYVFEVNATLPFTTNNKMKIEIANMDQIRKGQVSHIVLRLKYPSSTTFPRITLVKANGRILCQDEEHTIGSQGRTKLWAQYSLIASRQKEPTTVQQVTTPGGQNQEAAIQVEPKPTYQLNPTFLSPTPSPVVTDRLSELPSPEVCGSPRGFEPSATIPLIIGGTELKEGDFPWMAAIFVRLPPNNDVRFRCSGSLISNRHVVTVGHCIQILSSLPHGIENDITVVLGLTDLTNWQSRGTIRSVSAVSMHPKFKSGKSGHDLVVLTLSQPVPNNDKIHPICLWDFGNSTDLVKTGGEVAGWGRTQLYGSFPSTANKIAMPLVDFEDCLRSGQFYVLTATDYSFCGGTKDDDGPCVGDSGAGFSKIVNNKYYLRGIVAYLQGRENTTTCDLQSYVIFTDIANDVNWIRGIMSAKY